MGLTQPGSDAMLGEFKSLIARQQEVRKYRPVVSFAIIVGDELLIVKSAKGDGNWILPQEGVEDGEDTTKALLRGLKEELGIDKEPSKILAVCHTQAPYPPDRQLRDGFTEGKAYLQFAVFLPEKPDISVDPDELFACKWVPLSENAQYLYAESNPELRSNREKRTAQFFSELSALTESRQ